MVEALCQNTVKTGALFFSILLQTVQTFACEGAESLMLRGHSFLS